MLRSELRCGRRLTFAVAVPFVLMLAIAPASRADPKEELSAQLEQMVAGNALPAAVMAFVDRGDVQYRFVGAAGLDERSLFEIGSVTKVFTALLTQRLVERGVLQWSDTLRDRLGEDFAFASNDVASISLQALAAHVSGLPRLPPNFAPRDGDNPYVDYSADALRAFLGSFEPDTLNSAYAYSNLGFGLLGYLAAASVDLEYPDALRQYVIAPLALNQTYPGIADAPATRLAAGHSAAEPVAHWKFDALAGAGSMVSSAADMAAFVQLNLNPGEHPMAPALLAIRRPRVAAAATGGEVAFAWHVNPASAAREPIYWHSGGTGGFRSVIAFRPDAGKGIVLLANGDAELSNLALAYLLAATTESDAARSPETIAIAAEDLEAYVGRYALAPEFILTVTAVEEQLYAQATGQNTFPVFASASDRFFFRAVDAQLEFSRADDGSIDAVTLFQNGREIRGERLARDADLPADRYAVIEVPEEKLADYVGRYDLAGQTLDVQVVQSNLTVRLTGQPRFAVFGYDEDRFFYRVVDAQLHFQRNDEGDVDVVVLYQNGLALPAPKTD